MIFDSIAALLVPLVLLHVLVEPLTTWAPWGWVIVWAGAPFWGWPRRASAPGMLYLLAPVAFIAFGRPPL